MSGDVDQESADLDEATKTYLIALDALEEYARDRYPIDPELARRIERLRTAVRRLGRAMAQTARGLIE